MAELCLVGYTYRGYEMAYALEQARARNFTGIELRNFSDIDLSTPAGVERALDHANRLVGSLAVAVTSVCYVPLPVSRGQERADEEQDFVDVLEILARFHVPILHTQLSIHRTDGKGEVVSADVVDADYEAVQATLSRVVALAERHKVSVALETHMGRIHDTAASLQRILAANRSPWVVASLDFANMLITHPQENLVNVVKVLGDRIGYTHVKNVKLLPGGYDWNLPVRYGDINYYQIFRALKSVGYRGPLAIEYCGTGDPDVFVTEDARYVLDLVTRVGL